MKTYRMKLLPEYFNYIKNGTKRLELRLNDEKRKELKVNDQIIFEKLDEMPEYLTTKIVYIYKFRNFEKLIKNFDIEKLADKTVTKNELLTKLNQIYTKNQQNKYGVLAIEIELV